MSGIEVLGLISSIISIIEASLEVYRSLTNASGLPSSFHDVASQLPAINATLRMASQGLYKDKSDDSVQTIKSSVEVCKKNVEELDLIFRNALPQNGSSRGSKLLRAIRTKSKENRVTSLKHGIMESLEVLTASHAVQAATREQLEDLTKLLRRDDSPQPIISMYNTGCGKQTIHNGPGDQQNSYPVFSGVFHGQVNYTPVI